jgi:hypothetical protein
VTYPARKIDGEMTSNPIVRELIFFVATEAENLLIQHSHGFSSAVECSVSRNCTMQRDEAAPG